MTKSNDIKNKITTPLSNDPFSEAVGLSMFYRVLQDIQQEDPESHVLEMPARALARELQYLNKPQHAEEKERVFASLEQINPQAARVLSFAGTDNYVVGFTMSIV